MEWIESDYIVNVDVVHVLFGWARLVLGGTRGGGGLLGWD